MFDQMTAPARLNTPNSAAAGSQQLFTQNVNARSIILANAQNMIQSVQSGTIATPLTSGNVITITPRLVGLVKRFYLEISATIVNNDPANDITLTPWGAANLLSQVTLTDLSNNVRIQTAGWHLHAVASAKAMQPNMAAFLSDSPVQFGSVFDVISATQTIARGGGTGTIKMIYEIPLAYSDTDFRGAVWLNVVNATMTITATINPGAFVAAGGNPSLSCYVGSTSAVISEVTYNCYQNYLDQIPVAQPTKNSPGGPILPWGDLSTVYLLNNTAQGNIIANQDYPISFANFRDFLSTTIIFDNGGVLNVGSDVNYWAIQAANYINYVKLDPTILPGISRNMMMGDWPPGTYHFPSRGRPISTQQYGNQQVILNASTVNANARVLIGWEQFALINLVAQSGALSVGS